MTDERMHVQHYYSPNSGAIPSPENLFLGEIAINTADEKIMFKNNNDEIVEISPNNSIDFKTKSITYNELKELRDNNDLTPGLSYRITDYETITYTPGTQSAGHKFDIIVFATSENTLSEEAYVTANENEGYFDDSNLNAWKIWYSLDNNGDKFEWIKKANVNNPTLKGISIEYVMVIDGDNIQNEYTTPKSDIFFWYDYEEDNNGNNTLVLYKTDYEHITDEEMKNPDLEDKFFYQGTEEYDGVVYDKWRKIDCDYTWDNDAKKIFLTEQIVSNNTIKEEYLYQPIHNDGKGVIYRMIDEYGNDCPYDFKNIMFINNADTIYNSSNCSIDQSLVNGNSFNEPFSPVAYILNDGDEGYGKSDDLFYEYGYETSPDGFENQLCLFKSDIELYNEEGNPDYSDKFFYCGTYELDGVLYDRWKKAESKSDETVWLTLNMGNDEQTESSVYVLTERIVEGEVVLYGGAGSFYTFSWVDEENNVYDLSIVGNNGSITDDVNEILGVKSNVIGKYFENKIYKLPKNKFISTHEYESGCFYGCYNNKLGENCYNNTFSNNCNNNTFGNDCCNNTFGNDCNNNTFVNSCSDNTFGNGCVANTFDNDCYSNTFGDYCYSNTFNNYCSNNAFGDNCYNNTFGNGCGANTFGNDCCNNTFANSCGANTFGNDCNNNIFGNDCYSNTFGDDCYSNIFGENYNNNIFGNSCYNNILGENCYDNTFNNYCSNNTFGNDCYSNTFGNDCNNNTFVNSCSDNTFGISCDNNTLGNECSSNSFDYYCNYNTFGNKCNSNTFGSGCYSNTFGSDCDDNEFGNVCYSIIFGSDCGNNEFGEGCKNNTLGNECTNNTFGSGCTNNSFGNYCCRNTFGTDCSSNSFGNSCNSITFVDNDGNTRNFCSNNIFENYCSYIKIITQEIGVSTTVLQNLHVYNGFSGNNNKIKEVLINRVNSVITIDIYQDENGETCINKTDCGTF